MPLPALRALKAAAPASEAAQLGGELRTAARLKESFVTTVTLCRLGWPGAPEAKPGGPQGPCVQTLGPARALLQAVASSSKEPRTGQWPRFSSTSRHKGTLFVKHVSGTRGTWLAPQSPASEGPKLPAASQDRLTEGRDSPLPGRASWGFSEKLEVTSGPWICSAEFWVERVGRPSGPLERA